MLALSMWLLPHPAIYLVKIWRFDSLKIPFGAENLMFLSPPPPWELPRVYALLLPPPWSITTERFPTSITRAFGRHMTGHFKDRNHVELRD